MKNIFILFLISLSLNATNYGEITKDNLSKYNNIINQNLRYYDTLIKNNYKKYSSLIGVQWGKNNIKLSNNKSFTQYSKDLKQRETIDYENGKVTLEILGIDRPTSKKFNDKYKKLSKQTISQNTKNDPLFENSKIDKKNNQQLNKKIIKQKKIKDKDIKIKYVDNKTIYYIDVPLVSGYIKKLAAYYMDDINYYANRYDIKPSYILAIIQTESAFNPNAISHIPAFGLMQIVPNTAGKDIKAYLTGKKSKPSKDELINPSNNILMGTTYIKIIQSRYLKGIKNKENLYLCTSTAYNAGIGNLYKSFTGSLGGKLQTIKKINNANVNEIYKHLHCSSKLTNEAKQYVKKVRKHEMKWDKELGV